MQNSSAHKALPERLYRHQSRVVVITGATAGLGRAIALRFARGGDAVGLIARDEEPLKELRREIEAAGGRADCAAADIADSTEVMRAADALEAELGPIDIWVNDAMTTVFSPVDEMSPAEFRRVTDVTYLGQVHGTMAALHHMRPRRRGQIIQIGSALAYRGIPLQSAYCGAKHAVRGFTNALRAELIHARMPISVSIVEMPAMNTPQFDWARTHMDKEPRPAGGTIYQPEACAEAVYRAAATKVREYWVGRTTFMTIVGNILAPAWLDRYLARKGVSGQMRKTEVSPERKDNLYEPVTPLHRTRGDFSGQAKDRAMAFSGQATRAGVVALGALACLALGHLIGRQIK